MRAWLRDNRVVVTITGAILVVVVVLVTVSLRREPPETFSPSELEARDVGDSLAGPVRVTIDASDPERWVFFDFSRGAATPEPGPLEWDVGFRRFNITAATRRTRPSSGGTTTGSRRTS